MRRQDLPTRLIRPGEPRPSEGPVGKTPEERIAMMWPLVEDAWAFLGKPLDESRLPRHVVRVIRRKD